MIIYSKNLNKHFAFELQIYVIILFDKNILYFLCRKFVWN